MLNVLRSDVFRVNLIYHVKRLFTILIFAVRASFLFFVAANRRQRAGGTALVNRSDLHVNFYFFEGLSSLDWACLGLTGPQGHEFSLDAQDVFDSSLLLLLSRLTVHAPDFHFFLFFRR